VGLKAQDSKQDHTTKREMSSNTSTKKPTVTQQRDEAHAAAVRLSKELGEAKARIAELEAALAAAGGKKPKEKKAKTKKGRTIDQVLQHNLANGEVVYRSVGGKGASKVYSAVFTMAADGSGTSYTVDPALQPAAWGGRETTFTSPSTFASTCAAAHNADTKKHSINGWNVCYVIRDSKKVFLKDLRVAGAAVPAATFAIADAEEEEDDDSASSAATSGDEEQLDSEDEEEDEEEEA
jgi:hypothetical protein